MAAWDTHEYLLSHTHIYQPPSRIYSYDLFEWAKIGSMVVYTAWERIAVMQTFFFVNCKAFMPRASCHAIRTFFYVDMSAHTHFTLCWMNKIQYLHSNSKGFIFFL